ncbi:MAG: metal ABC transporter ATP-binding protein [Propionibacteriaceae bacterium]|jgi:zinc transport system ATP-binding protein|nr:metal ABC transporter ATP-binding protein [Propionibacteriaceae bacterium]
MSTLAIRHLDVALGGNPILTDITVTIEPGQIVALLGDNGSGKSTLIKATLGLIRHQRGSITLLGTPLERFHTWNQVGYVPQRASVSLHSTTVAEVVRSGVLANRAVGWPGKADKAKVAWALETVGLSELAQELYLHLSGGQQQRVLIARGIVNRPDLLIMDEPFAGVDLTNQTEIGDTVAGLGATVWVVLHETESMAAHLDRTLILRDGRLIYDGSPTSVNHAGSHETEAPPRTPILSGMEPRWTS